MSSLELLMKANNNAMLLTKSQTAKAIGLSEATIDRLRKAGKLTSRRVGGSVMFSILDIALIVDGEL